MSKTATKPENRSQLIRDMLTENPTAKPKEIVATLKSRGVKVSSNLVYLQKKRIGKPKRQYTRRQVAAPTATHPATNGTAVSGPVAIIQNVRRLAADVGGIVNLQQLVDELAK